MRYMGSKDRLAKYILPIILKDRLEGQYYVEPFCGGCNTLTKVVGNRIASDNFLPLIEMWKAIQSGWTPPQEVSEEDFKFIKYSNDESVPLYLKGYVGFNLAFGASWLGGYARAANGAKIRNPGKEAYNNISKQFSLLEGVSFICTDYTTLTIPSNSIIYCDPPYRNTVKYPVDIVYDHFYQWCRDMKGTGHTIYISEYSMPEDFTCVWEKEVNRNLIRTNTTLTKIEKLFTL
jgi:DNA adenine methylase